MTDHASCTLRIADLERQLAASRAEVDALRSELCKSDATAARKAAHDVNENTEHDDEETAVERPSALAEWRASTSEIRRETVREAGARR